MGRVPPRGVTFAAYASAKDRRKFNWTPMDAEECAIVPASNHLCSSASIRVHLRSNT
jgi:hypothetical protein